MRPSEDERRLLGAPPQDDSLTIARNLSTRYVALGSEMVIGLLILPFNVAHLGAAAYGLWMLAWSVTAYFSVLDFGYQNALIKYVARYRAQRDVRALNELLSSMFYLFAALAVLAYLAALLAATYLDWIFQLSPEQVQLGRTVLLIVAVNFSAGLVFGVYGGVVNGFQRYDLNNLVSAVTSIVTALVNIAVLLAGYGLVELVASTTAARLLFYLVYRANAYRVFPGLSLRPTLFRLERVKEITPFSMHMLVIDWAVKINYSVDVMVVGAFLNTTAVAVWSIAQRLSDAAQRVSNQLNEVLFPTVVDNDAASRLNRLQSILLVGTRLSLATVIPIAGTLCLSALPLIVAWVGPDFAESAVVLQVLALTAIFRVGTATSGTVLKGTGNHRFVAVVSVATALLNLALSLILVRSMGLMGVALGTLLPVSITSVALMFPVGCRRLGVPFKRAWREAVWPALWPAAFMTIFALLTRGYVGPSLLMVAAHMLATASIYLVCFGAFALRAAERQFFLSRLKQLIGLGRRVPVAVPSEGA